MLWIFDPCNYGYVRCMARLQVKVLRYSTTRLPKNWIDVFYNIFFVSISFLNQRFVGVCHANGARKELSHVETMRCEIHSFANLNHKKGEFFQTPSIRAHGFSWVVDLYPRGTKKGRGEDAVGIFVQRAPDDDVAASAEAKFEILTNDFIKTSKFHNLSRGGQSWGGKSHHDKTSCPPDLIEAHVLSR